MKVEIKQKKILNYMLKNMNYILIIYVNIFILILFHLEHQQLFLH